MRKKIFSILAGVMMIALTVAGVVYAHELTDLEVEGWLEEVTPNFLVVDDVRYEIVDDSEIEEEIAEGVWVKIKYYDDADKLIILEVEIEEEPEMDDDDMVTNSICSSDLQHPALLKLAISYEMDYETLEVYFCEQGFGIGEIKHALRTAELGQVDSNFVELLNMRSTDEMKNIGWGEIWQDLGLIGNGKQESEFQLEGEEEQFEYKDKNKEKNKNKPGTSPGQSGEHPGKGKGRGN